VVFLFLGEHSLKYQKTDDAFVFKYKPVVSTGCESPLQL
jgi:hypothetical protein